LLSLTLIHMRPQRMTVCPVKFSVHIEDCLNGVVPRRNLLEARQGVPNIVASTTAVAPGVRFFTSTAAISGELNHILCSRGSGLPWWLTRTNSRPVIGCACTELANDTEKRGPVSDSADIAALRVTAIYRVPLKKLQYVSCALVNRLSTHDRAHHPNILQRVRIDDTRILFEHDEVSIFAYGNRTLNIFFIRGVRSVDRADPKRLLHRDLLVSLPRHDRRSPCASPCSVMPSWVRKDPADSQNAGYPNARVQKGLVRKHPLQASLRHRRATSLRGSTRTSRMAWGLSQSP